MTYVKIQNGVVVQKQPYEEAGFIEAPDSVVGGFLYNGTTFTAPAPPVPTPAEMEQELIAGVETYIDTVARDKHYDNHLSCTARAGFTGPYQAEGTAFGQWMDTCYVKVFEVLEAVQAGERTLPTVEAMIAELPEMVWPTTGEGS